MNCKPGDLAYVVGSPVDEINGQTVDVLSASAPFKLYGPGWVCTNHEMRSQGLEAVPIPDSMLRPIGGVPVHDDQLNEVPA